MALQEAAEAYFGSLFEDTNLATIHAWWFNPIILLSLVDYGVNDHRGFYFTFFIPTSTMTISPVSFLIISFFLMLIFHSMLSMIVRRHHITTHDHPPACTNMTQDRCHVTTIATNQAMTKGAATTTCHWYVFILSFTTSFVLLNNYIL